MSSALKPALTQQAPPSTGQGSPAKANVANVSNSVGHPQGAQNSLHHGSNNLVGQNLTHPTTNPPQPSVPHIIPSMAPVSANMAQMAQNMSHHGNLSNLNQNPVTSSAITVSPTKAPNPTGPLSLVQEKINTSQPLALTRTQDKKELDPTSNGTVESPKSGLNASISMKAQSPETNKETSPESSKEKSDLAKTTPSTPKPIEKVNILQTTPQKPELNVVNQLGTPDLPKPATANEPDNSPAKPVEPTHTSAADVAPSQSDSKPVPEPANDSLSVDKVSVSPKQGKSELSSPNVLKSENSGNIDEKQVEKKDEKVISEIVKKQPDENKEAPKPVMEKKEESKDKVDTLKKEDEKKPELTKVMEKPDEKKLDTKMQVKPEIKPQVKTETKPATKSTLKLATVTTPMRKRRQTDPGKSSDGPSSSKKPSNDFTPDSRSKRNRTQVQLYQSPTPELAMATKLSASAGRSTPTKGNDDKLIVFYKNEYLAVRNAEGSFYVCQANQNVYKTTRKIKIRWLSQDKVADPTGETYKPDFYDTTDKECVLTTLSMSRAPGGALILRKAEEERAQSILQRALRAEQGDANCLDISEEHPDGLDLSLYNDEAQLEKKSHKRKSNFKGDQVNDKETAKEGPSPSKKSRMTPKGSPKTAQKATKLTPVKSSNNTKRKSTGSTPTVASTSKTATAVTEKSKGKTPTKRTPVKVTKEKEVKKDTPIVTPVRQARRSTKENKSTPLIPTPSTSTGKTTRTPRKPPAKK